MHDSRLAKIESDVRGFVRASNPEMTIRAEYWAKDRSRIALFFIDERFRTLYRRQRFHYLAHLIPKDDYDSMLADKRERSGTTRITLAAGIAALVGPACAVLPYTDYLPPRLSPDLAGVWLLAAHRGHRHWHRRLCVPQGQQGRRNNLRPDQYPRPRLLGIHRRFYLPGWREVSHAEPSPSAPGKRLLIGGSIGRGCFAPVQCD